jgi:hypothetical protein
MAWEGEGADPWLPQRLDARLQASAVEDEIRTAFWAVLAAWLVQTARQVLRGDRPDTDAVWARVPAWRAAVDQVVQGEIRAAMGTAYTALLGDDYRWDQRPFVARYLAEARNRLVRTPDEVYDLLAHQIVQGVNLGESIPKIRDRVDNVLSITQTERWPNRATVVARTETIGALNAGRYDAFRAFNEEADEPLEKLWLSTTDTRTRESHRLADGQRVPVNEPFNVGGFELEFPGDPSGPPQEVIQCRCTMLLVELGETVEMSNRQFRRRR